MTSLLQVPLRSTEDIDIGTEISNIISKEFYQTSASFEKDINYINGLRHKIYIISNSTIHLEESIAPLKEYVSHLKYLSFKFPLDFATFAWYTGDLSVGYTSSNSQSIVKVNSLLFEEVNIIYSIGSIYSYLGVSVDKSSAEGIKKASKYFQLSSGCFEIISRLIIRNEGADEKFPPDLQLEVINFLKTLTLAQAQEFAWLQAVKNGMKNNLIAKLAQQVAVLYDGSLSFLKNCHSFYLRNDWSNQIKVKNAYFQAVSQYRQSLFCAAEKDYGQEVARLKLATKLLDQTKSYLKFLANSKELKDGISDFSKILNSTLSSSEKDNDYIYLKAVPDEKTLFPITPACVVSSTVLFELENPTSAKVEPLFFDLLPFYVVQVAQSFRERQEEFVLQRISEPLTMLDTLLDKFLASKNVTMLIETSENGEVLPKSVVLKIEEMKNLGGISTVENTINDIFQLAYQNQETVVQMRRKLELEKNEDDLLRQRYGTNFWTRSKSSEVNKEVLNKVAMFENLLSQAKRGDEVIREDYANIKEAVETMCNSSIESLEKLIPKTDTKTSSLSSIESIVNGIKTILSEVSAMKINRKKIIEIVKTKSSQMNILPKVISKYKILQSDGELNKPIGIKEFDYASLFEEVLDTHLKGFDDDVSMVSKERDKQIKIENELGDLISKLTTLQSKSGITHDAKQQEFFLILEHHYAQYMKLIENLNEGLKFYNDFVIQSNSCVQSIDSFIDMRRKEARELESHINGGGSRVEAGQGIIDKSLISPQPKNLWKK